MEFIQSLPLVMWAGKAVPIAIGAAGGFAYYKFVGCKTGMCPITKNPWISTLYGALMGSLWIR